MSSLSPTKTQFYSANGAGRDSYIYGDNGGFAPMKEPCKIEALGKFNVLFLCLLVLLAVPQQLHDIIWSQDI